MLDPTPGANGCCDVVLPFSAEEASGLTLSGDFGNGVTILESYAINFGYADLTTDWVANTPLPATLSPLELRTDASLIFFSSLQFLAQGDFVAHDDPNTLDSTLNVDLEFISFEGTPISAPGGLGLLVLAAGMALRSRR